MTDHTVRDIIDYSAAGQPLKVADAFSDIMKQKVNDRIAEFEAAIRPGMFSAHEEPELEDDLDLDDVELDDLDLEDDDDDGWDDADETEDDLDFDDEDLDLDDEDFTDEDA